MGKVALYSFLVIAQVDITLVLLLEVSSAKT